MRITRELRARVGAIPRALVRREAARFMNAAKNCRSAQSQVLVDLLALNAGSRFSRQHRLEGVRNATQYRRRVPVVDYEYFRPYIDEVKAGQHDALLGPKNRLLMFSLTSGTTAQAKYIPITERFLADYRNGWQAWGIQAIDAHPGINSRMILQLSSDFDLFRTPGGTPCGNISGLVAACQKRIVRTMYSVPGAVAKIRNSEAKLYTTMRLAVAERNIGMVMTANPSTLIQLAKLSDARKEDLIRDIADGTLSEAETRAGRIRTAPSAAGKSRKRQARAAELEAIVDRTGTACATRLLARYAALGHLDRRQRRRLSARAADDLRPNSHSRSRPVRQRRPHDDPDRRRHAVGILDVTTTSSSSFPRSEYGKPDATVLEAHELEEGTNYYILLTTSSGLYRYNIFDVVRCTGFLPFDADGRVPAQGRAHRQRHGREDLRVASGPRGPQRHRRDVAHALALHRQPGLGRSAAVPAADRAGRRGRTGRRFARSQSRRTP